MDLGDVVGRHLAVAAAGLLDGWPSYPLTPDYLFKQNNSWMKNNSFYKVYLTVQPCLIDLSKVCLLTLAGFINKNMFWAFTTKVRKRKFAYKT